MKLSLKLYIMIAVLMLLCAIAATVLVFFMLQDRFQGAPQTSDVQVAQPVGVAPAASGTVATASASSSVAQPAPIALKDVPLTDGQRSVAESFGVDTDTFVITPAMQVCARNKLGAERIDAIVAGDTPTLSEGLLLLQCL